MPREQRCWVVTVFLVASIAYAAMGVGYHGLQDACYASRHSVDRQPPVLGGALGFVIDVAMWPAFLPFSGGQSCQPLPAAE